MMKNIWAVMLVVAALCSCGDTPEEKAAMLLDEARHAVAGGEFERARGLVDSLRATYPKAMDVRRSAIAFSDTIEMEEAKVMLADADSMLVFKLLELAELKSGFVLEKNAEYQTVGYYVCPEQVGGKMHRTSLRAEVNEEGQMVLISIVHGTKIAHERIRVTSVGNESAETPRCFSFLTHDVVGYEEEASYKLGEDNGVIEFIAKHEAGLDIVYIGADGREIKAELAPSDISAVRKCYDLAVAFAEVDRLKSIRDKMAMKVRFYEKKISLGR